MPGKEVQRHIPALHLGKEPFIPYRYRPHARIRTGHGRTADTKVGETAFEVLYGNLEEIVEFLRGTGPTARIHLPLVVVPFQVGLVPDLPVLDVVLEAVGPAFIVMADDVLADLRPLLVVLGRIDSILLQGLVLDTLAQAVEHLHACILDALDIPISQRKVVGLGLVRVLGKVREDDGNVDHMLSVCAGSGGVVVAGIAHVGGPEIAGGAGIDLLGIVDARAVVDGIHTFDGTKGRIGRDDDLSRQADASKEEDQRGGDDSFHNMYCVKIRL